MIKAIQRTIYCISLSMNMLINPVPTVKQKIKFSRESINKTKIMGPAHIIEKSIEL